MGSFPISIVASSSLSFTHDYDHWHAFLDRDVCCCELVATKLLLLCSVPIMEHGILTSFSVSCLIDHQVLHLHNPDTAGFFWGKTPLIKLSPKKTWEGFIGGFLGTVLSAMILANILSRFKWMTCPRQVHTSGSSMHRRAAKVYNSLCRC